MSENDMINTLKQRGISPEKLAMLMDFADQSKEKNPKDLVPFFLRSAQSAGEKGMDFSDDETSVILDVLMPNMSEADKKKVAAMRKIAALLSRRRV